MQLVTTVEPRNKLSEQTAILVHDHGEWVLVIDSDEDEPERAWKNADAAIQELRLEGWQVVHGPATIEPSVPEINRFNVWGYRLKRGIQRIWGEAHRCGNPRRLESCQLPLLRMN